MPEFTPADALRELIETGVLDAVTPGDLRDLRDELNMGHAHALLCVTRTTAHACLYARQLPALLRLAPRLFAFAAEDGTFREVDVDTAQAYAAGLPPLVTVTRDAAGVTLDDGERRRTVGHEDPDFEQAQDLPTAGAFRARVHFHYGQKNARRLLGS